MKLTNIREVGNHFRGDNIFLATVVYSEEYRKAALQRGLDNQNFQNNELEGELESYAHEKFDVFYKDENGYTCFMEAGPETFAGDNSDGKGVICNVVPVWDYYPDDAVKEAMINGSHMAIIVHDSIPLYWYSKDCGKIAS